MLIGKFAAMKVFATSFFLALALICGPVPSLSAQATPEYSGFRLVADLAAFKKEFAAASAKVQSVQGSFVQEKTLFALTEKITSRGKLWFKREDKVRMDYESPFVYKMIINGDKVYIRDGEKESQLNVRSNKLFQQVNRIMIDCMQGTILESSNFTVRAFENDAYSLLELTPVSKNLKEFFQTIVLWIDKKDHAPRSIELNEPSGDKTLITLSDKTVNGQIRDEVFTF